MRCSTISLVNSSGSRTPDSLDGVVLPKRAELETLGQTGVVVPPPRDLVLVLGVVVRFALGSHAGRDVRAPDLHPEHPPDQTPKLGLDTHLCSELPDGRVRIVVLVLLLLFADGAAASDTSR